MVRKILAVLFIVTVALAFTLPTLAQETVKAKVDALDKEGKKITIAGTEYNLSDEAAAAEVALGDNVEATVDQGIVTSLAKAAAEEAPAQE